MTKKTENFNSELITFYDELKNFALRLTSSRDNALDLVQETIFKAISYKDNYRQGTNMKAWLFTIMKNTFINQYRRQKRQMNVLIDNWDYTVKANHKSNHNIPESTLHEKEINEKVYQLDNKFRIPFTMHFKGYKYREISDELSINLGTVKSRIFFARKELRKSINREYQ